MEFVVKEELLNGVLQYLATRPYAEVAGLIKAIHEGVTPHGEIIHEDTSLAEKSGQES